MNTLLPGKHKTRVIECRYFRWRLRPRDESDVWYADGRGNRPNPGRHSLDTRDYEEAVENLKKLDLLEAVRLGRADPSILSEKKENALLLEEGRTAYFKHLGRPRVTGGVAATSTKRYRPVFDKFLRYLKLQHVQSWNHVKRVHLENYAAWLDDEGYAYATEFLELTTIKQAVNFFIDEQLLPSECRIVLPLTKPTGTDTYCYREQEVIAMLQHCDSDSSLLWLRNTLAGLAYTGMRISELATLRKSDVDLQTGFITLTDESFRRRAAKGKIRSIKNRRTRSFPILDSLQPILVSLVDEPNSSSVFTGPNGLALRPDYVRICLKRDVLSPLASSFPRLGEVGFEDGRLHSFRHYFCSLCANSSVDEFSIMDWLGHRSSAMVKHYYHQHRDESLRQMSKIKVSWRPGTT